MEDEALESSDPLGFTVKKVKDLEDQISEMKSSFEKKLDELLAKS